MNYFKEEEFACQCGCGFDTMNTEFVNRLNIARFFANIPFVINSGCRCDKRNREVEGTPNSEHKIGCGVDIKALDSRARFKIVYGLIKAGITRIKVRPSYIHAGFDKSKDQEVLWLD